MHRRAQRNSTARWVLSSLSSLNQILTLGHVLVVVLGSLLAWLEGGDSELGHIGNLAHLEQDFLFHARVVRDVGNGQGIKGGDLHFGGQVCKSIKR